MNKVNEFFDSVLTKINDTFNFVPDSELDFHSIKARGLRGSLKVYHDEKIGVLGFIKARTLLNRIKTYNFALTPIYIDGITFLFEYNIRFGVHTLQIKLYNTALDKNIDFKNIKNKALITKKRFNKISDYKLNEKGNTELMLDWSIGKRAYNNDSFELIKISNNYLMAYLEFLKSLNKCKANKKLEIIRKFNDAKINANETLTSNLKKILGEEKAVEEIRKVLGEL